MKRRGVGFLWILILIALAGAGYYFWQQSRPAQQGPDGAAAPPPGAQAGPDTPEATIPPTAAAPPAIRYPIPAEDPAAPPPEALPKLDESDAAVEKGLSSLLQGSALLDLLRDENIIRHIVVTIDNLPRKVVAQRLLPVRSAEGRLETEKSPEGLAIAEENFKRYAPFVAIVEQVDAGKLVALYTDLYPLFQAAYRDLGYPDGYFNDRLVDVIDHMLAAPEPAGPILVQQPHILYRYADPALENSSAGHKIMIRIGKDNAQKVKQKLREIREALTQRPAGRSK